MIVEIAIYRDGVMLQRTTGLLTESMDWDISAQDAIEVDLHHLCVGWTFVPKLIHRPFTRHDYDEELAEGRLEEQAIEDAERFDRGWSEPD